MIFPARNKISNKKKIEITDFKISSIIGLKPSGIWYSCGSSWYDWIKKERMEESFLHKYIHQIYIKSNSTTDINNKHKNKLLVIKNIKDFDIFNERYKIVYYEPDKKTKLISYYIDWQKVSKHYGGIEIRPYFKSRKLFIWYNTWDVASGCIWNINIIKKFNLIYKKIKGKYIQV